MSSSGEIGGNMERKHDVVDDAMVREAISGVLALFASLELTVAECIKVSVALDRTFKAEYPEAYDVLCGKYSEFAKLSLPVDDDGVLGDVSARNKA